MQKNIDMAEIMYYKKEDIKMKADLFYLP